MSAPLAVQSKNAPHRTEADTAGISREKAIAADKEGNKTFLSSASLIKRKRKGNTVSGRERSKDLLSCFFKEKEARQLSLSCIFSFQ
jgi:hypothetical protein